MYIHTRTSMDIPTFVHIFARYNRQRNLLPIMDKVPWIQPDTWVAPNAVVTGNVDIYDKVCLQGHEFFCMHCNVCGKSVCQRSFVCTPGMTNVRKYSPAGGHFFWSCGAWGLEQNQDWGLLCHFGPCSGARSQVCEE